MISWLFVSKISGEIIEVDRLDNEYFVYNYGDGQRVAPMRVLDMGYEFLEDFCDESINVIC